MGHRRLKGKQVQPFGFAHKSRKQNILTLSWYNSEPLVFDIGPTSTLRPLNYSISIFNHLMLSLSTETQVTEGSIYHCYFR